MPNPDERFYLNRLVEALEIKSEDGQDGLTNKNVEKFQIQVNQYRKKLHGLSDREINEWNPVDGMYTPGGKTERAMKWWKDYDKDETEKETWEVIDKARTDFESIPWDKR